MKKYVLCSVVESDICTPQFFDTYEEAHAKMKVEYEETIGMSIDDEEYEEDPYEQEIYKWTAYCVSANHDNCNWAIFEVEV